MMQYVDRASKEMQQVQQEVSAKNEPFGLQESDIK